MNDHYATLGVAKNATPEEIKKAYRRLAAIHHPDKGGDTAEFQKVQAAYETLSDPQKKQQHDNPNPFGNQGGPGGFPGGFQFHNGFDMNDIFSQMFGSGFRQPQKPSYRTTIWVTLEQVYSGGEQTLQFNNNGQASVVKIQIPKGVENGQTMRYDNLVDGVLIAEFRVHPHQKFQREGPNLYSEESISILDLIVGTSFNFTTISGKTLSVTVKPQSHPGSILRIQGEGLPMNNDFGDQMIVLKPVMPAIISDAIIDSINQHR
jgi:molecular chaperone DnaJ